GSTSLGTERSISSSGTESAGRGGGVRRRWGGGRGGRGGGGGGVLGRAGGRGGGGGGGGGVVAAGGVGGGPARGGGGPAGRRAVQRPRMSRFLAPRLASCLAASCAVSPVPMSSTVDWLRVPNRPRANSTPA